MCMKYCIIKNLIYNSLVHFINSFLHYFHRLISTIEVAQKHIQNVIDGDMSIEEKIYGTLDVTADIEELSALHKELEGNEESAKFGDDMKKAKIGVINLKAYISQVDCEQMAAFLKNTFLFKVRTHFSRFLPLCILYRFCLNAKVLFETVQNYRNMFAGRLI
jgi:hypothetical protein